MLISANNLSKTNGIKNIVDNVTFSIEETDKVALIGVNGCLLYTSPSPRDA